MLSTPPYGGGGGGSLLEIYGLKNINNFPIFPLPRKPQILARKGAGDPSSLPARRYNKAVGGFPYCVS